MAIEVNTKISIGETYGKGIPNLILEDAKFWGRPNFSGELDRFNDNRRKFTVFIPVDVADQIKALGYMVGLKEASAEEIEKGYEPVVRSLKVFLNFDSDKPGGPRVEDDLSGPEVHLIQGDDIERLNPRTVGLLDRARLENMDMEIRGWEYNPEEHPGMYSARLVKLVATITPSILDAKYGRLR